MGALFRLGVIIVLFGGVAGAAAAWASPGDVHFVQAGGARLRQAPDRAAPEILRLGRGQKLLEFERRGAWVRVGVFGMVGREGWISGALIGRSDPDRPSAAPEPPPAVVAPPGTAETPRAVDFLLRISGTPALAFSGDCQAIGRDGVARRFGLRGHVPDRIAFTATALSCRIRKEDFRGRLRARLWVGGRVIAEAETRAPLQRVTVRSAGPWGDAAGLKGGFSAFPGSPSARALRPARCRR